jgi:hypothetical protein
MTITSTEHSPSPTSAGPAELLIKEARQASRRRRLRWFTLFIVIAIVTPLTVFAAVESSKPTPKIHNGNSNPSGSALAILPCTPSAVSVANGPVVSPAIEEDAHSLELTNEGSKSCLMSGFPRLVVYGATGAVIPFRLVHHATGGYAMTSKPPKPFALAPRTSAFVLFAQVACEVGTETTTSRVALFLPNAKRPSKVFTLLRPIAHCVGQSASYANPIGISPIEPTMAATEQYRK